MGLFLSMSGVVRGSEEATVEGLRAYIAKNTGTLEPAELTSEDDGCLVVTEGVGGITVLYPADFFDWDGVSEFLSRRLGKPVFSFHIHDDDLWMYSLYDNGEIADKFNPLPDYWKKLSLDKRRIWQGNAAAVAKRVPGLAAEQIASYLVEWNDDVARPGEKRKAYSTDRFHYGSDWQLLDFMNKIGLQFPIDDRGNPHGATYRFHCEPAEEQSS